MGLRGGAARPSTGYAFARIQAQADHVAARVAAGTRPLSLDGPATRFMDRVFLQVLQTMPERGPALFESAVSQRAAGPAGAVPVRVHPSGRPAVGDDSSADPSLPARGSWVRHDRVAGLADSGVRGCAPWQRVCSRRPPRPDLATQLLLLAPLVAILGLPHGALDLPMAEMLWPLDGWRGKLTFVTLYLGLSRA